MCNTVMCSQDVTRWQVIRSLFELFDRTVRSLMAPLENFCWQKRLSRTKSRYQKIDLGILNRNYPRIQPIINSGIPQVPILVPKWVFRKIGVPQIIHFNRVFHYKPSILGYQYFWKHPNPIPLHQNPIRFVWVGYRGVHYGVPRVQESRFLERLGHLVDLTFRFLQHAAAGGQQVSGRQTLVKT